ncbi:MAG: hypothetical protein VKJ46_10920 [Leptolyngbyaceae bacterium]|nr:hypothetical protein [Leptolyngbyaceae bacterium]
MPPSKQTHVVSSTPGRARLRVAQPQRTAPAMSRLAKALKARPTVQEVRTNLQTGSLLVHYDAQRGNLQDLVATLENCGVVVGQGMERDGSDRPSQSAVAQDLTDAVSNWNQTIGSATDYKVDLQLLVPLGLAALAIRQVMRNGLELEAAPWYVLAYYAFDTFLKLNRPETPQPAPSEPTSSESASVRRPSESRSDLSEAINGNP